MAGHRCYGEASSATTTRESGGAGRGPRLRISLVWSSQARALRILTFAEVEQTISDVDCQARTIAVRLGAMGRTYDRLDDRLREWMERQPVFFVSTAPLSGAGHVNCSPKGNRKELVILDDRRIAYLDQTGSGVETIAHLRENGRIVLMFCAFEGPPRIVRVHGRGRVVMAGDDDFGALAQRFPGAGGAGVRSVIVVEAQRVSDSCGYAVPLMSFESHRATLDEWADRKGRPGVEAYWAEKNQASIDDLPGIVPSPEHRSLEASG